MKYWHKKRLAKLAKVLLRVPREKFCMSVWYGYTTELGTPRSLTPSDSPKAFPCGTAGCALGWACIVPSFYKAGLRLVEGLPDYKGYSTYEAAGFFFGLSEGEAKFLFHSSNHGTAKDAAKRIGIVLRNHATEGA
jgi:hypothetical protein